MRQPLQPETHREVDPALIKNILIPYKDHCKYLKSAKVEICADSTAPKDKSDELIRIHGDFSIPESCYIASTGHFNSVEFNICYNQLVYVLLGYCVDNALLEEFAEFDIESYFRRQLPDILIVNFSSSFKRPINGVQFSGGLAINRIAKRKGLIMVKTTCHFYDDNDGHSDGEITLAIVNTAIGSTPQEHVRQEVEINSNLVQ